MRLFDFRLDLLARRRRGPFRPDPSVQQPDVRVQPVSHGPVEIVSVFGDVHRLVRWRGFQGEEDKALVGPALKVWPFGQPKFVVEVEDNGVVRVERTLRILVGAVDNFTVADWASVLDESVVSRPENRHLGSSGPIPKENRLDAVVVDAAGRVANNTRRLLGLLQLLLPRLAIAVVVNPFAVTD